MSGPEPASEVEAAKMANGSGPLPEDMGMQAVAEKNSEEKNNGDENKDGDQNKDGEARKDLEGKKESEENGMKKVEDEEEGKDEKKTEDVNTGEAEDVKMVDAEDRKTVETEDVKMVNVEDARDGVDGVKEVGEEEGGADLKVKEADDVKEDNENMEKKVDYNKVEGLKSKRESIQKISTKREAKEKKERGTKLKELSRTPTPSSIDRPVRERKTVERLVEVIEKEPNKEFLVEKGRGTPLKDIPNVAHKLARKKPADLKLLHQTLFGRKGKAVNFRSHILQFSGFVWHESDEKQRAKMKEKLDKYVKDTLLDLCDLFDIPVSRTTMRKEDLVAKLLDFMVAPHATTDVILADKQQSMKSRKRKRVTKGSASKGVAEAPPKQSRKKQTKREDSPNSKGKIVQENEEEVEKENENGISDEDEALKQSEFEVKESESEEAADEDEDDNEDSGKSKEDKKRSSKQRGSVGKEKSKVEKSSRKSSFPTTTKSPTKVSSSKRALERPKAENDKDVGAKVFSRKKRNVDAARKKSTLKSDKKEKATGKRLPRGKGKSMEAEYPSEEELRKTICEILKEVDFNTATFTDILKQLATHYKKDLTPRKPAIKELIQEELTKLADEAEEDEDDEDEDAEKEENPEPSGKEVKT
uniref:Protein DEK isoform X2 n=1 Tax=Elaeis guineensis var. tenera TaxID=51953 RepID=A0A6I9QBB1_ELAGV|nr:protein DEK isoform X2 [Elaeis guineensis]